MPIHQKIYARHGFFVSDATCSKRSLRRMVAVHTRLNGLPRVGSMPLSLCQWFGGLGAGIGVVVEGRDMEGGVDRQRQRTALQPSDPLGWRSPRCPRRVCGYVIHLEPYPDSHSARDLVQAPVSSKKRALVFGSRRVGDSGYCIAISPG